MPTTHRLYFDVESKKLLTGYANARSSCVSESLGHLTGDKACICLYFAKPDGDGRYIPTELEQHVASLKIERPGRVPQRGKWQFCYQDEKSCPLDINDTLYDICCAINAMATVQAAGGVECLPLVCDGGVEPSQGSGCGCRKRCKCKDKSCKGFGGKMMIQWCKPGPRDHAQITTQGMLPPAIVGCPVTIPGDDETNEVFQICFAEDRLAHIETWEPIEECELTVERSQAGTSDLPEKQVIKISPEPAGGTFSLEIGGSSTPDLSVHISAIALRNALRECSSASLSVRKLDCFCWEVEWHNKGAKPLIEACDHDVVCARGLCGTLEWNDPLLCILLGACETVDAHAQLTLTNVATGCRCASELSPVNIHRPLN